MSWVAAAVVGGAVIGGVASSSASSKAANAQTQAADKASETQLQMYNQTRDDQAPWRAAGATALGQMAAGTAAGGEFNRNFTLADFTADPGYDFRMQQGQTALDRSAAARGGVLSGAALKGTERYSQDYASNEYQNAYNRYNNDLTTRYNRLASLAGTGQTATAQTGAAGTAAASAIGENTLQAGNAAASGYVGTANAITNGAQTIGNYFTTQQMLNKSAYPGATTAVSAPSSALSDYSSFAYS